MLCGTLQAETAHRNVSLGIFGTTSVYLQEDGTYRGTTKQTDAGPATFTPGTVIIDGNDITITSVMHIRNARYTVTLKRDHRDEDALNQYDRFVGTFTPYQNKLQLIHGIPLKEGSININTKTQIMEITGTCQKHGLSLTVGITAHLTQSLGITVSAALADVATTWYPFANTHLPKTLRDIVITDIGIGVKAGSSIPAQQNNNSIMAELASTEQDVFSAIEISGTLHALHITTQATAEIGINNGEAGIALIAKLPENWHITDSFPHITQTKLGELFNRVLFHDARCVITSFSTYTISDREYRRGCNIEARMSRRNESHPVLDRLFDVIGTQEPTLFIKGSWDGESPKDLYFKSGVSGGKFGFSLGPTEFFDGNIFAELTGQPSIGLGSSCKMRFAKNEAPLEWYVGISATPQDIALAGSMRNTWHNPFGAKGIHIRNLALKGAQSYDVIASAPASMGVSALLPSQAGISGEGDIELPDGTDATFDIKANLGKNITALALLGYLRSSISFDSLTRLLLRNICNHDLTDLHLPHIHLEEACLKLVPLGTYIGQVRVEQGIGASCYVTICGKRAYIDIGTSLSEMGLHLYGHMPRIDIGPLHITSADAAQETGPTLDTVLNLNQQHLCAHGRIQIGDICDRQHHIAISKDGISFGFDHKLGPLELSIQGATEEVAHEPHDFTLTIAFTNNTISHIHHLLKCLITRTIIDVSSIDVSTPRSIADIVNNHPHVLEKLLSLFHIEHIYFKGSAQELIHGTMPYVHVSAYIAGERKEADFQFDFKHPRKSMRSILIQLLDFIVRNTSM